MATKWLTISLALALAASVLAQPPAAPDITGTWVYNPARSKLPKDIPVPSHTITITRVGKTYSIVIKNESSESTHLYTVDGHEHTQGSGTGGPRSPKASMKAAWKGRVLVTSLAYPSDSMPHVQRWSLSSGGSTLTREADDPEQILVFVYDRE